MVRLCFNIELPETDLRVGKGFSRPFSIRSLKGYKNRELKRFYPLILCLETLCQINEWHHRQMKIAPLYKSGVVYQEEPPGEEEWLDVVSLYKQGWGDCEDIACARVAELRRNGVAAVPCIKYKDFPLPGDKSITLVHVMTLWPDDFIEDPSKALGMKGEYS